MNKGDTVVFVQTLDTLYGQGITNLIEMTVDRDYGDKVAVSDGARLYLVSNDLIFPNMETAVKAVTMQMITRADDAEIDARQTRQLANDWLRKLEDFD